MSIALDIKSLPPLSESVTQIQQISNNPNAGVKELTDIVQKDPMLTANLLKAANSPLYGFSREITNISQAISLFGMATVKGFALASSVKNTIKIDLSAYGINEEYFSDISQLHNALMSAWYKKTNPSMLDVLSPASFLLGLGKVIMSNKLAQEGKAQEFLGHLKSQKVLDLERQYFGVTSSEVCAQIFEHWRFDTALVESIRYSNEYYKASKDYFDYALALNVVQVAMPFSQKISDKSVAKSILMLQDNKIDTTKFEESIAYIRSLT